MKSLVAFKVCWLGREVSDMFHVQHGWNDLPRQTTHQIQRTGGVGPGKGAEGADGGAA